MERNERAKALLEGGGTLRYHTQPMLRRQTVAEHTWRMLVLLDALHPDPPMVLFLAVLLHDVQERWTGDVPGPAKWCGGAELGTALTKVEYEVAKKLGCNFTLTPEDRTWLKGLDMVEAYAWAVEERAMGNHLAGDRIIRNLERVFHGIGDELPDELQEFVEYYAKNPGRLPDVLGSTLRGPGGGDRRRASPGSACTWRAGGRRCAGCAGGRRSTRPARTSWWRWRK